MERKICTHCYVENMFAGFSNKHTECKICNSNRVLKCYHENKGKISNQRKLYYEKKGINYYKNKKLDI